MTRFLQKVLIICFSGMAAYALTVIPSALRDDFFSIYRHAAVKTRDFKELPVTRDNVTYYLYTRDNPQEYIKIDNDELRELAPYKNNKIVIFVHGWTNSRDAAWYEEMKNVFLKKDYNVIEVDWKEPADQYYYVSSINTYDVAKILSELIANMYENLRIPLENILLIGHSLGGHIVGFTAQKVYEKTGKKLPRIVAMDPAGPLFEGRPADKRLNSTNAEVVHVIHTDGGTFGYTHAIGTLDFFVNGGSSQPGCKRIDLEDLKTIAEPLSCDHRRAPFLFAEAVAHPNEYLAHKCENWDDFKDGKCDNAEAVAMGDLKSRSRGKFFLKTGKDRPFYQIEMKEKEQKTDSGPLAGFTRTTKNVLQKIPIVG